MHSDIYIYINKISYKIVRKYLLIYSAVFATVIICSQKIDTTLAFVDPGNVYKATLNAHSGYINTFQQQIGFYYYCKWISFIFGHSNTLVFALLNIILLILIYYSLIEISYLLFNSNSISNCLNVFLFLCFGPLILVIHQYNDYPAFASQFYALVCVIRIYNTAIIHKSLKSFVFALIRRRDFYLSIILLVFATVMRENSIIISLSIVVFCLILLIKNRNLIFTAFLFMILISLSIGIVIPKIHNSYLFKEDLDPIPSTYYLLLGNMDGDALNYLHPVVYKKMIKGKICKDERYKNLVGCGFSYSRPGLWNSYGFVYIVNRDIERAKSKDPEYLKKNNKYVAEQTKKDLKKLVKYRINNPVGAMNFYKEKFISTYGDSLSDGLTMMTLMYSKNKTTEYYSNPIGDFFDNETTLNWLYVCIFNPFYLLCMIFSVIALWVRRKKLNYLQLVPLIAFIGGFLFHVFLWETRPRYVLPYMLLMLIYAAVGYDFLYTKGFTKGKLIVNKILNSKSSKNEAASNR